MISGNTHPATGQNLLKKVSQKDARFLSITFDDGLKNSTDIAISILGRYGFSATFYIVTGWVEPKRIPITEPFNIGRSHGTWDYWRQVSAMGHEIGSHTHSHVNARGKRALLFPWIVANEIARSHEDLCREVPQSSHSIAMPWNAATCFSEFLVRRRFASCRLGTSNPIYNDLPSLTHYRLESWAPSREDGWADYVKAIDNIPKGGWLILQFHGIGDEGWDPITPECLNQLCGYIAKSHLRVGGVREIINGSSA
jgi:peptidoglycan/xylan/chitin deacetylase (PgdA/CDA1 family)